MLLTIGALRTGALLLQRNALNGRPTLPPFNLATPPLFSPATAVYNPHYDNLLRQLVPVISPAAEGRGESCKPEGWHSPEAMIASATTVHDPHPDRLPIPDDYSIEDANADLFG